MKKFKFYSAAAIVFKFPHTFQDSTPMFLERLRQLSWNIDYDGFSWLLTESINFDKNKAYYAENLDLTQDMLQISSIQNHSNDEWIIDVGWYPDSDENGNFRIVLIKNRDWENPLISYISHHPHDVIAKVISLSTSIQQDDGLFTAI